MTDINRYEVQCKFDRNCAWSTYVEAASEQDAIDHADIMFATAIGEHVKHTPITAKLKVAKVRTIVTGGRL